ncbi:PREDICTED: zinc finger C2HC domain-containing protein CBG14627-like [Priapulus caudatus]|uniref:Zinc finger C2HC domain-containing protein CBG14627-like n=1 Tax=Priapulus caudatus TaxID=37621 RepID=A0ABM1DSE5_PRICU|nr:PREDICTED: zinc finger C2HC domain-containing protein CBG14627-like [Priapulus caudatus]
MPGFTNVMQDFKQCPYCNRNFSPSAADRHIEFCKEQSARKTAAAKAGENDRAKLQDRRTKVAAGVSGTKASTENDDDDDDEIFDGRVVEKRFDMRTQRSNLTKHNAAPASRPAVNGAPKPPVAAPPSRTQSKLPAKTATKNVAAKQSNGSRQQAAASKIPSSSSTPDFKSAALRTLSPAVGADVDDPTCGAREMSFTRTPSEQALYHPRKSDDGGYESGAYYSAVSPSR